MDFNKNMIPIMAAVGEEFSNELNNKGVDLHQKFDEFMEKHKDEKDPSIRLSMVMADMKIFTIKNLPIMNRVIYLCNTFNNEKIEGKIIEDADVKWDQVNEILSEKDEFDYNVFGNITSISDLFRMRGDVVAASLDMGAWHVHKCVECNKYFYMSKNEVNYYAAHNLKLPKRCRDCREKKKRTVIDTHSVSGNTYTSNAMKVAFEKAQAKKDAN